MAKRKKKPTAEVSFKRKKIRGQRQETRKTWMSDNQYRIIWRSEVFDVEVPPKYQATVRIILPDGREMWDFVSTRRLFKTFKSAKQACEEHCAMWEAACNASGIRELTQILGTPNHIGYPVWAKNKMNRKVYELLTADRKTRKRLEKDDEEILPTV